VKAAQPGVLKADVETSYYPIKNRVESATHPGRGGRAEQTGIATGGDIWRQVLLLSTTANACGSLKLDDVT
jgi:hypothetical protein